jgi:hypothetical protein
VPGTPSFDGIDHTRDQIWILLNPEVDVSVSSSTVSWTFKGNPKPEVVLVYAGNLLPGTPIAWDPALKKVLDAHQFTDADYQQLLQTDPLTSQPTTTAPSMIDQKRYQYYSYFEYQRHAPPQSIQLRYDALTTHTDKSEESIQVGYTLGAKYGGKTPGAFEAAIQNKETWEWTNSSSKSIKIDKTATATATIFGVGDKYSGELNWVDVYYDTIYRTFAFALRGDQPVLTKGTVLDASGKTVAGALVTLEAGGTTLRTFTNADGQYTITGKAITGPYVFSVGGTQVARLPTVSAVEATNLRLKQ